MLYEVLEDKEIAELYHAASADTIAVLCVVPVLISMVIRDSSMFLGFENVSMSLRSRREDKPSGFGMPRNAPP